ncbi:hypothetical protein KFE26_21440 [Shewanella sp. M16]|uniref:hypothetical protein n=1 Tax=Shewanella sp. M16 TaxID=2830837 RepID=UPI001BB02294|nr:hypothetical protein [Shewanella sp. M16]MBS0044834.1 hypothetical protein [Shewanella sp. M16]
MNRLKVSILTAALLLSASSAQAKNKNELACEAILCAVGIAIPASHNECRKVLIDWNTYLATLGFFSKPPKCPKTDATGMVIGYEEMDCDLIQDAQARQMCHDSIKPPATGCAALEPEFREQCECQERNRKHGGRFDCQIR